MVDYTHELSLNSAKLGTGSSPSSARYQNQQQMRKSESLLESKFNLNLIVCDLLIRDNLVSENNEMVGGGP